MTNTIKLIIAAYAFAGTLTFGHAFQNFQKDEMANYKECKLKEPAVYCFKPDGAMPTMGSFLTGMFWPLYVSVQVFKH